MRSIFLTLLALGLLAGDGLAQIAIEDPKARQRGILRKQQRPSGSTYASSCPYTVTQVDIPASVTGTGYKERIQIMTSCGYDPNGADVPLILVWNGWGLSAGSFFNGMSDIPDEANLRGWLVVVITGIDDKNFGAPLAQQNVEVAVDYMLANYKVDEDRIYGIGWSAGGGAIAAYTARHLDPQEPMIAAVATNAGTYDLVDTYWGDTSPGQTTQQIMEHPAFFGGPPVPPFLWNYLRAESEDHDTALLIANEPTSQMRNLLNIPIYHVYSTDDTIPYIPDQNQVFASYLSQKGANITTTIFSGLLDPHDWSLLDAKATLDFLQQYTVDREPTSFEVNADRDTRYYWADITHRVTDEFSNLSCAADVTTNSLDISGVTNIKHLALDPPTSALDLSDHFSLTYQTNDPGLSQVTFNNVPSEPTYVLDYHTLLKVWDYDATQKTLTLDLWGAMTHQLEVRFDNYSASLTGPATTSPGHYVTLDLAGSTPSKPYLLLLGFKQGVFSASNVDPLDDRNILVGLNPLPVFFFSVLGSSSTATIGFVMPNDPTLVGSVLFNQFVTYPGSGMLLDEFSNRHSIYIVPGP